MNYEFNLLGAPQGHPDGLASDDTDSVPQNTDDYLQAPPFQGKPPKSSLYHAMRTMFETGKDSDVTVEFPSENVKCHKLVLDCFSPKFADTQSGESIECSDEKVPIEIFHWIYVWMVKEGVEVPLDLIVEIFRAATSLDIPMLVDECWSLLDQKKLFHEDTAYAVFLRANRYGEQQLKELMLSRIKIYFLSVVASLEFDYFKIEDMKILLTKNLIAANCESEVFMAAIRWLDADWGNREKHAIEVMSFIRFGLMPAWFLTQLSPKYPYPVIQRVVSKPAVNDMIKTGIMFTIGLTHMDRHKREFRSFLKSTGLKEPIQRAWVYDRCCPHHYLDEGSKEKSLLYEDFLKYRDFLRAQGPKHWQSMEIIDEDFRWVPKRIVGDGQPPAPDQNDSKCE